MPLIFADTHRNCREPSSQKSPGGCGKLFTLQFLDLILIETVKKWTEGKLEHKKHSKNLLISSVQR